MTLRTWLAVLGASTCLCVALERGAHANYDIFPLFDSGPAVIAHSVSPSGIDGSTVIFGRRNGGFATLARQGGIWWLGTSEEISLQVPGGFDSDPAAAYLDANNIMICGHSAAAPGNFWCSIGSVNHGDSGINTPILFPVTYSSAAGGGTFYAGSSPAIVVIGATVYLFGRGQDNQLWYATCNVSPGRTPTWSGWWPISAEAGGFDSDPTAVDEPDGIRVCAHKNVTGYVCSSGLGSYFYPVDSTFSGISSYSRSKPAIAASADTTYLLAVGSAAPRYEYATYEAFGEGGPHWTDASQVGPGYGFLSNPAAVSTIASSTVLTVNRGSDSHYWYDTGSSAGWGGSWTAIQARYSYSSN
jgi:hypothetical protein